MPDASPAPPPAEMDAAAVTHYENFPVASWMCPRELRPPIAAIYHFARTADDLADEGDAVPALRLQQLADYRTQLAIAAQTGDTVPPVVWDPRWAHIFGPLKRTIASHQLPVHLLHDLLDAFVQDIVRTRDLQIYADMPELLDYCRRSANPVGRLLLHLWGVTSNTALEQSDAICTALQLINFWQDPSVDLPRGRLYFTREHMDLHSVPLEELWALRQTPANTAMIKDCVAHARSLMQRGAPLIHAVPGRAGWELRMVVQGGLRVLHLIEAGGFRTLERRPALRARDAMPILWAAIWM